MAVEYNGANPEEVEWAEAELKRQRAERLAMGHDAICTRCGQQGPARWMVNGVCGSNLTEFRVCGQLKSKPPALRDIPLGWQMSAGIGAAMVVWGYLLWRFIVVD